MQSQRFRSLVRFFWYLAFAMNALIQKSLSWSTSTTNRNGVIVL